MQAVLFFGLDEGKCPGAAFHPGAVDKQGNEVVIYGKHEAAGLTFKLVHGVPGPNRETPWCKCSHCKALFWNGWDEKGVCPGRKNDHVAEPGNPDFQLAFDMPALNKQQNDWRFCDKCFGLFFLPHNADGKCPAGGNHHAHHFNYVLDIA